MDGDELYRDRKWKSFLLVLFIKLSPKRGAWRGEEGNKGRAGVKQTISTLGLMTLELNSNEHFANSRA